MRSFAYGRDEIDVDAVEQPGDVALVPLVHAAFARRVAPLEQLGADAGAIADLCADAAARFRRGGTLLSFGTGGPATDAQHVSVEFVHPVIVGKRALPAVSLAADAPTLLGVAMAQGVDEVFAHQLAAFGGPDDIAVGVSPDGRCRNVLRGLEVAHEAGMLTVALVGGDGGPIARSPAVDHVLVAVSDDDHVVKEAHVSAYHLLWEHVHVHLDAPEASGASGAADAADATDVPDAGDLTALYPFLYAGSNDPTSLRDEIVASAEAKVTEVMRLRGEVAEAVAPWLAACAVDLAGVHRRGGRLLTFGNGGSSTDAQEVAQCFLAPRPGERPIPALCLTNDVAVITALSNDVDFDVIFSRQIRALARPEDAVVGLSTSGNSANVLAAFAEARRMGLTTIGLAGSDGGEMAAVDTIDHLFVVPSASVHRIQEVQTTLYHVLQELVQAVLRSPR